MSDTHTWFSDIIKLNQHQPLQNCSNWNAEYNISGTSCLNSNMSGLTFLALKSACSGLPRSHTLNIKVSWRCDEYWLFCSMVTCKSVSFPPTATRDLSAQLCLNLQQGPQLLIWKKKKKGEDYLDKVLPSLSLTLCLAASSSSRMPFFFSFPMWDTCWVSLHFMLFKKFPGSDLFIDWIKCVMLRVFPIADHSSLTCCDNCALVPGKEGSQDSCIVEQRGFLETFHL